LRIDLNIFMCTESLWRCVTSKHVSNSGWPETSLCVPSAPPSSNDNISTIAHGFLSVETRARRCSLSADRCDSLEMYYVLIGWGDYSVYLRTVRWRVDRLPHHVTFIASMARKFINFHWQPRCSIHRRRSTAIIARSSRDDNDTHVDKSDTTDPLHGDSLWAGAFFPAATAASAAVSCIYMYMCVCVCVYLRHWPTRYRSSDRKWYDRDLWALGTREASRESKSEKEKGNGKPTCMQTDRSQEDKLLRLLYHCCWGCCRGRSSLAVSAADYYRSRIVSDFRVVIVGHLSRLSSAVVHRPCSVNTAPGYRRQCGPHSPVTPAVSSLGRWTDDRDYSLPRSTRVKCLPDGWSLRPRAWCSHWVVLSVPSLTLIGAWRMDTNKRNPRFYSTIDWQTAAAYRYK